MIGEHLPEHHGSKFWLVKTSHFLQTGYFKAESLLRSTVWSGITDRV